MNSKTEANEKRRSIIGSRLREVIDRANYTQSRLLNTTKYRYGHTMTSAQLSMIIAGKRSLPPEYISKFSKILNEIDPGYLAGLDDLKASNYDEYLMLQDRTETVDAEFSAFITTYNILAFAGYSIETAAAWEGQQPDYIVSRRGKSATISADKMDQALDDIKKYIRKRIEPLLDL